MPSRRDLLAIGATVISSSFAGCSAIWSVKDSPPELTGLTVGNEDAVQHTVDIVIIQESSVVYWNSYRLEPIDDSGESPEVDTETISGTDLSLENSQYTVNARLDDHSNWQSLSVSGDAETQCATVEISVKSGETGESAQVEFHLLSHPDPECKSLTMNDRNNVTSV